MVNEWKFRCIYENLIKEEMLNSPVLYPGLYLTLLGDFTGPFGDETLISTHGEII